MIDPKPLVNPLLARLGIDTRQFWLLTGLFQTLTERREMFDQLGREGTAIKTMMLVYFLFSSIGAMVWSLTQPQAERYLLVFLGISGFLMFSVLLSETGNSLMNATEALLLAHRPIRGITYTAAKLTHLGSLVVWLTAGLNAAPAIIGLTLPGAGWLYPLRHISLALLMGFTIAFACCALYGWLLRLAPPRQLKLISNVIETLPFVLVAFAPPAVRRAMKMSWLPQDPHNRQMLLLGVALLSLLAVVFGLRALSTDFLLRVAGIVHGGRTRTWRWRLGWSPNSIAAWSSSQPARAAYSYAAANIRRDWQFRRRIFAMVASILMPFGGILTNLQHSPFEPRFSAAHALPHIIGFALFLVCSALPYGNQPPARWVFLLAPPQAWPRFAQGLYAMLWVWLVLVPHALLLGPALYWPAADAFLFTGYSLALSSLYLALTLQILDAVPFTKPVQPDQGAMLLPAMMVGGVLVAIAVVLQYFLIFRSRMAVPVATIALAAAAWLVTRWSLQRLAVDMQFGLAQDTGEVTAMYTEVNS